MNIPTSRPLKVGLMVPANNTTMEAELLGWLPAGSQCHTLKIPRGPGLLTQESLPAYKQAAVELSAQFGPGGIDVLAYGCTAAGFILGPEGDRDIAQQLHQSTGVPVVTTARAMMVALAGLGAKRISLLTPYADEVNQRLRAFLASEGIEVIHFYSFEAPDTAALGRITESEVEREARRLCRPDVDALFIACSQLPTLKVVQQLQREGQGPVLSSIQVTAEQVQQAQG
ncbi:MAG: aspartate/glutamate racemase family protein [Betaproteobacteria bacterium]